MFLSLSCASQRYSHLLCLRCRSLSKSGRDNRGSETRREKEERPSRASRDIEIDNSITEACLVRVKVTELPSQGNRFCSPHLRCALPRIVFGGWASAIGRCKPERLGCDGGLESCCSRTPVLLCQSTSAAELLVSPWIRTFRASFIQLPTETRRLFLIPFSRLGCKLRLVRLPNDLQIPRVLLGLDRSTFCSQGLVLLFYSVMMHWIPEARRDGIAEANRDSVRACLLCSPQCTL